MCTVVILRRPGHRWPVILGANRDMLDLAERLGFTEESRDGSQVTVVRRLK